MRKYLSILVAAIMMISCLTACGSVSNQNNENRDNIRGENNDKIKIVTTIFPEYDWVMNILGDKSEKADVTMLLDNGVDLHSYQPTAVDILKIATCDLFIYVGGESDEWVKDALKEATNKDMVVVDLLATLGDKVKEEDLVEGMESEEKEEGEEEGEEGPEYDEHVWLSLSNASYLADAISKAIQDIDPANAAVYKSNTAEYTDKLNKLDTQYKTAVSETNTKTLLFGDRFPFRYLVDDYGLSYYAAFAGCSAETEASFETITFLAKKVDELNLDAVMTVEGADHSIAETIVRNTQSKNQQILTMNSMQSTTSKDVLNGNTYLSIMEDNLAVLKKALK